ncbi:MAG: glycoside hydrolase family 117 protein [Puniceicoccaceae bacterium]
MKYRNLYVASIIVGCFAAASFADKNPNHEPFPYVPDEETANRPLSAAMERSFNNYLAPVMHDNELYSQFKYTKLKGFDYSGGDGTVTRRDPSKVLMENGKYYVWYTKRHTKVRPVGMQKAKMATDVIPSADWDLADVWYATSDDGFTWEEQGVAVKRPPEPDTGWRSCVTPDILKWKGKFYLYYQAFNEPSGLRGDDCVVSMSYADSPDGPWTHSGKVIIPTGPKGAWDHYTVQAPTPLIHNGQIYMYYKVDFNAPGPRWSAMGLATADDPFGPFKKHPLNPVQNSGHEICYFPFKEGLASLVIRDGNEHFTIQYAEDWVNFEIAAITEMMPIAPNAYIPDAFADNGDGRGIIWGICHFRNVKGTDGKPYSELARFDCDLSLDVHDPAMKDYNNLWDPEDYYRWGLNKAQRARIDKTNEEVLSR